MKLAARIFLAYLLISVICFSYPASQFFKDLRTFFLESVEDPLADHATLLAAMVGTQMETGRFNPQDLYKAFDHAYSRSLTARIYGFQKKRVDLRIYITDPSGKVIFDSLEPKNVGADYSRWRDVSLTLKGEYGTRTTRLDPKDPRTSILFVAAPIIIHGKNAGVVTVAKPTTNINAFVNSERPRILKLWYLAAASAIALSFVVSLWLTHPIKRLTRYANKIRDGKRPRLPPLGRTELRDMGLALEDMREALEGKKYVERYVQTLTHEIKSPLSAIKGAAELLDEQMPTEKRQLFLSNIRTEANRIQDLVDRMLKLSELEARKTLQNVEPVCLNGLLTAVLESKGPILSRKGLQIAFHVDEGASVPGDLFLLHQAVSNIVQNAIDFSPSGGTIAITATVAEGALVIVVDDEGPGIPEYCRDKIFNRFFSLQRPDTGKKSTGLGLNFVREVAILHGGGIQLDNLPDKGLRASLSLPI
ncbi:sensor histidine kinase CreC, HAMP domain-containing [Geotalea daltonii FRC-32]|uniref:histidine kinase n=1 Tax=Geotalea daltonii (strain DSM 22248 / JCM 15807 / FRC-32) TaxID=316067 RepID=B9M6W6_GEODF|nr:two-component system sensor histidine kinase CreC [Geotalea daltonii]ACM21987.1 sensor histidine kinase CreC, HAMP domain-containing [Geotalea daltonii FRC-32]